MSLLGYLVPGCQPDRAAAIALAHILDLDASPGLATAFVDLVGQTSPLRFEPGRVEGDPNQKDDSPPDVTIYDEAGRPRVCIETAFWEGVHDSQPVEYLRRLPDDLDSGLVYIAPRKRMGAALLRRRFSPLFIGVFAHGHSFFGAVSGGTARWAASPPGCLRTTSPS